MKEIDYGLDFDALKLICSGFAEIKLGYLFGSRVSGRINENSDFDFAFYLDCRDSAKRLDIRLSLINLISRLLKTDKIDVIIINDTMSSVLKYNIVSKGILFYVIEPFKVEIVPKILNEYFDYEISLRQSGFLK